jgi:hypothetical protein
MVDKGNVGGYSKNFSKTRNLGFRDTVITNLCRGKKLVHIGCTDWPNQKQLMSLGTLLHQKLFQVVDKVVGVDIDEKGIFEYRSMYPNEEFYIGDVGESDPLRKSLSKMPLDLILIPDVIEHIEDGKTFLLGVRDMAIDAKALVVLTTPNAFALKTFLPVFLNLDYTHPDHCALHNEFTLRHLIEAAGFEVIDISYYQRSIAARYGRVMSILVSPVDWIAKLIPRFGDGIILTAKPSQSNLI